MLEYCSSRIWRVFNLTMMYVFDFIKCLIFFFFFKQKTAYEILADWSSDVCSSDLDGWSFEAADASFELLLRAELPDAPAPLFQLESYRTSVEHWGNGVVVSEATVKVHVDGERIISTGEGNGPVNALDNALRQALVSRYPRLADVSLADYKVRILGWKGGTGATTRVLIDSTDGVGEWTTVGVHDNIVEASWHALVDALTYAVRNR